MNKQLRLGHWSHGLVVWNRSEEDYLPRCKAEVTIVEAVIALARKNEEEKP